MKLRKIKGTQKTTPVAKIVLFVARIKNMASTNGTIVRCHQVQVSDSLLLPREVSAGVSSGDGEKHENKVDNKAGKKYVRRKTDKND